MEADYKCPDCSYQHTCSVKKQDQICPLCHSKMERVWTAHPVIFKGAGFYKNDYPKGEK